MDSLKIIARQLKLYNSALTAKDTLFNHIDQNISDNDIPLLLDLYAQEIKYGNNRRIYIQDITLQSIKSLATVARTREKLQNANLPIDNFNEITSIINEPNKENLIYLKITPNPANSNEVLFLDMCFLESTIDKKDEAIHLEYVWITIDINSRELKIKLRPMETNKRFGLESIDNTRFRKYSNLLHGIFNLDYRNGSPKKTALYRVFKNLTEQAEKPFAAQMENLKSDAVTTIQTYLDSLDIDTDEIRRSTEIRFLKLLERALIQENFSEYYSYSKDKLGIVASMNFRDRTGASVRTKAFANEGINLADIYFDVKETIHENKIMDNLWVDWFKDEHTTIKTRFEAHDDYYLIHILYKYYTEEDETFVISSFKKASI